LFSCYGNYLMKLFFITVSIFIRLYEITTAINFMRVERKDDFTPKSIQN
jgi:hypothetical protein